MSRHEDSDIEYAIAATQAWIARIREHTHEALNNAVENGTEMNELTAGEIVDDLADKTTVYNVCNVNLDDKYHKEHAINVVQEWLDMRKRKHA